MYFLRNIKSIIKGLEFYYIFFFFLPIILLFFTHVICMTLEQYAGFLLISKLDYIIKCKNLIFCLLIQYFEAKWVEKVPLNFDNSLLY